MLYLLLACTFCVVEGEKFGKDALQEINQLSADASDIAKNVISAMNSAYPLAVYNQLYIILGAELGVLRRIVKEWKRQGRDEGEEKYTKVRQIIEDAEKLIGKKDEEKHKFLVTLRDILYRVYVVKETLESEGLVNYYNLKNAFDSANASGIGAFPDTTVP
uniref:Uncharacterized protein n=1 Tax=Clastoptera arizonana TaxID=38151 RepID=A0A1B6CJN1_9HEMI